MVCVSVHAVGLNKAVVSGGKPVYFEEAKLKQRVEETLGVQDPNGIDMLELKYLDISSESLRNLVGLESANNLEGLNASYNFIEDLQPILQLEKIRVLDISGCPVKNLNELRKLGRLKELFASCCLIEDISFVRYLGILETLVLRENGITDLRPLQSLYILKRLVLDENQISDISPLSSLPWLEGLGLGNNRIRDISVLKYHTKLEKLSLYNNQIDDIASLERLKNLYLLNLNNNPLNDQSMQILSKISQNCRLAGKPTHFVYFGNHRLCRPGKPIDSPVDPNEYIIARDGAAISPDEKFLVFTAGYKTDDIGLPDNGRAYVLELGTEKPRLHILPKLYGVAGISGQFAWSHKTNPCQLLANSYGFMTLEPRQMKIFSIIEGQPPLETHHFSSGSENLLIMHKGWTPDDKCVMAMTLGKCNVAMLDIESKKVTRHDLPTWIHLWADSETLWGSDLRRIYQIKRSASGEFTYKQTHTSKDGAWIVGFKDGELVYSLGNKIYIGEELIHESDQPIFPFFGDEYIAFQEETSVEVIDLKGQRVFRKKADFSKVRIMALAGKAKKLYLLNNQQTIEAHDLEKPGEFSVVCDIETIIAETFKKK